MTLQAVEIAQNGLAKANSAMTTVIIGSFH
jgi:hypothetical protein